MKKAIFIMFLSALAGCGAKISNKYGWYMPDDPTDDGRAAWGLCGGTFDEAGLMQHTIANGVSLARCMRAQGYRKRRGPASADDAARVAKWDNITARSRAQIRYRPFEKPGSTFEERVADARACNVRNLDRVSDEEAPCLLKRGYRVSDALQ